MVNLLGLDDDSSEFLRNVPSFSIQSLINQIPGEHFDTNEFLSDSITSKYYTPAEFITAKLPKNKFSIIHLNIVSLSAIKERRVRADVKWQCWKKISTTVKHNKRTNERMRYPTDQPTDRPTNKPTDGHSQL